MKQLASASVKCLISEGNKEIIKRALSAEFELDKNNKDDPQWKGNELEFNLGVYKIHVTIDVLPDFRGYLISAKGNEQIGCLVGLMITFSVVIFVLLKGNENIWTVLFGSFMLACLLSGMWSTVDGWKAKLKMRNAFKKASQVLN